MYIWVKDAQTPGSDTGVWSSTKVDLIYDESDDENKPDHVTWSSSLAEL